MSACTARRQAPRKAGMFPCNLKILHFPMQGLMALWITASASHSVGGQVALQRLVTFSISDEGTQPASLIEGGNGCLYGTTSGGRFTNGTVFKMTPGGQITAATSFDSGGTSNYQLGALVKAPDESLYGVVSRPWPDYGAIFHLTAGADLSTLFSFDGANGSGARVLIYGGDGNLYGTTPDGGSLRHGSVFKLTLAGEFITLCSFSRTNGINPTSLVRRSDGTLFGTTSDWIGVNAPDTVFRLSPSGELTTLVSSFTSEVVRPWSIVLSTDGCLYGVDGPGGSNHLGVVFKVTPSGTVTKVAEFDGTNGSYPDRLIEGDDGNLYGTTAAGGPDGSGTVFRLAPDGELTVLASFQGLRGDDVVGLTYANGVLYGAITSDDAIPGMVFRLAPRPRITGLRPAAAGDVLSWSSFAAGIYRVEHAAAAGSINWVPAGPEIVATSNEASLTNPVSAAAQRYYRVRLLP
jgi:uncharacterized repeat protein (TIGR03803 family)